MATLEEITTPSSKPEDEEEQLLRRRPASWTDAITLGPAGIAPYLSQKVLEGIAGDKLAASGVPGPLSALRTLRNEIVPDPIRRFGASSIRNYTLLPAIAGYAGAGYEALGEGLKRRTAEEVLKDPDAKALFGLVDRWNPGAEARAVKQRIKDWMTYGKETSKVEFMDSFTKALESGPDRALAGFGEEITDKLFEGVDLSRDWPQNTWNIIADIAGTWLGPPLPSKALTGPLGIATMFATPAIRVSKGAKPFDKAFKTRAGVQLGVGGVLDQAVRAYVDQPLMFSKEALTAPLEEPYKPLHIPEDEALGPGAALADEPDLTEQLKAGLGEVFGGKSAEAATYEELFGKPEPEPGDGVTATEDQITARSEDADAWIESEVKMQEAEDRKLIKQIGAFLGAAAVAYGAVKYRRFLGKSREGLLAEGTEYKPIADPLTDAFRYIQGAKGHRWKAAAEVKRYAFGEAGAGIFSERRAVARAFDRLNIPKSEQANLPGEEFIDYGGRLIEFMETGILPSGQKIGVPLRDLKRQYDLWPKEKQQAFTNYIAALSSDASRTRATAWDFISKTAVKEAKGTRAPEANQALREIEEAFANGSLDDVENALLKHAEYVAHVRGTKDRMIPSLYKARIDSKGEKVIDEFVGDDQVLKWIRDGHATPEFARMQKQLSEISEAMLEEGVRLGVFSRSWANAIKHQFSRNVNPLTGKGDIIYLPGREAVEQARWWQSLSTYFGTATSSGKHASRMGNVFEQMSLKQGGGIGAPLDPFNSLAHYMFTMMEHTGRSADEFALLAKLTGLEIVEGVVKIIPPMLKKGFAKLRSRQPIYIGRYRPSDPKNQFGKFTLELADPVDPNTGMVNKVLKRLQEKLRGTTEGTDQALPDVLTGMERSIIVQHKGDFYIFGNLTRGLKQGLEFDPALTTIFQKFSAPFRRLMTVFTTGKYSLFAPISGSYNAALSALAAALRSEKGFRPTTMEAYRVWKDSMISGWDLFAGLVAKDYAQILAHALETNSGFAKLAPGWTKRIQEAAEARTKRFLMSPLSEIRSVMGKAATGLNEPVTTINVDKLLLESAFPISEKLGGNALPQIARIWRHINEAFHEGTKYGVIVRKASERAIENEAKGVSREAIWRRATAEAIDITGDPRLRGSWLHSFNSAVPFSGAMFSAWTVLGRAMAKSTGGGGLKKTMATIAGIAGMPTALEIVYTSTLLPDEEFEDETGKKWTYKSWFWEKLTHSQRTDNVFLMVPGKPPWEAPYMRVYPEWSIFRGIVLDAMELVFGLSTWDKAKPDHIIGGVVRAFDIPLPPYMKMIFSSMGIDVRAGPYVENIDDLSGVNSGQQFGIFKWRDYPVGGNKYSGEEVRYVGEEVSVRVKAMLQDIFGAGMTVLLRMYETVNGGKYNTLIEEKTSGALDVLGREARRQAPYASVLFPNILRISPDPGPARAIISKMNSLNRLAKHNKIGLEREDRLGGRPILGDVQEYTQDPVVRILAASAENLKGEVRPYLNMISDLRSQLNSMATALSLKNPYETNEVKIPAGPITIRQREAIMDDINVEINRLNHTILEVLTMEEKRLFKGIGETLNTDLTGETFDGYKWRSSRPFGGSTSPAPPTSPQTSQ